MQMVKHCVYYDDDTILVISQNVLCSFVCIAHSIVQRISLKNKHEKRLLPLADI